MKKFACLFVSLLWLKVLPLHAVAYAQLSSVQNQIPSSSNAMPIVMEIVHEMKNFELGPKKDSLVVKEDGVYFLFASGQIGSVPAKATGNVDIWFVKNGIGIPDSTGRESLDKATSAGLAISKFVTTLSAGDTISTYFATSRASLGLVAMSPEGEPMIASFLFSIFKITEGELP